MCATGDVDALLPLLDPSVIGWADLGDDLPAVPAPTVGARPVAEGVMRFLGPAFTTTLVARSVNGEPGVVALRRDRVFAVLALTVRHGRITRLYAQVDPRKLARVREALLSADSAYR